MAIEHKKKFGVYHWDTFDNQTILIHEGDNLPACIKYVKDKYGERIRSTGADQVDIVDSKGNIAESFKVG